MSELIVKEPETNGFPLALVQRCLWEIAIHGGKIRKAHESLKAQGVQGLTGRTPSYETLKKWKSVRHRDIYEEILRTSVDKLDDLLAAQATQNAINMGDALDESLRVTLAGLADSNGVEASQILRNIAQARQVEIDKRAQLQGRDAGSRIATSLDEAMRELASIGVVRVIDENPESGVIDSEVVHPKARERIRELTGEDV